MQTVLIAVGGNAIYDRVDGNNLSSVRVAQVCRQIVKAYAQGFQPVITFGNGPQVGNLLEQAEQNTSSHKVVSSLDDCVAWTQGEIGYWLTRELLRQFAESGQIVSVIAVNTLVEVDPLDLAFRNPTKPIGRFIEAEDVDSFREQRGWFIASDANRGYRRMVPSPRPLRSPEVPAIAALIAQGVIVLCGGGGGIPVCRQDGVLNGIEAVIDKDFTSCLLAKELQIPTLVICTEIENVCLNYGTAEQQALYRLSVTDAERYQAQGQFAAGSMGPKVEALIDYIRQGGQRAIITSLDKLNEALEGEAGTEIVSDGVVDSLR
jgi:carbamate kinase